MHINTWTNNELLVYVPSHADSRQSTTPKMVSTHGYLMWVGSV